MLDSVAAGIEPDARAVGTDPCADAFGINEIVAKAAKVIVRAVKRAAIRVFINYLRT